MVTSADREPPRDEADGAALFESMMAYSGKYRVEGEDKFITSADPRVASCLERHRADPVLQARQWHAIDHDGRADAPAISGPTGSWRPDLAKRMSWTPALPWRRERGASNNRRLGRAFRRSSGFILHVERETAP